MGWLSGSRSLSSRKEGHSFAVFVYFLRMCPSVGSQLAPRLALWLSLAELPERGLGGAFLLCCPLFGSPLAPGLAWLSLAELPGEGGGLSLLCFRWFLIYLSIILVVTCPWAGSLTLAR